MLAISLVGGLSALLTQPRALGPASHGASRSGHVRCLIKGEVDESAMFAASTFPIKPDALIERAKEVLEAGVGTKDGGACLAPDFEFCAAVVGPLGKEQYLGALDNFRVRRHARDSNNDGVVRAGWSRLRTQCTPAVHAACVAHLSCFATASSKMPNPHPPATRTRHPHPHPHPHPPSPEPSSARRRLPRHQPQLLRLLRRPFRAAPRVVHVEVGDAPPCTPMQPPAAMQPPPPCCSRVSPGRVSTMQALPPCSPLPACSPLPPCACPPSLCHVSQEHGHPHRPAAGQAADRRGAMCTRRPLRAASSSTAQAAGWPRPAEARGGREPAGRGWPRAWANGWLPT